MINLKTIYKVLGALLFIESALLTVCLVMAFAYEEDDTVAFLLTLGVTSFAGFMLRYMGRESDNVLSRRDAYLVVALAWVVFSLFGMLPFIIGGYLHSPTDAFFEAMSGFTTTGASVLQNVDKLPHALLFWRSLMQWIGGLGIVFFTIALLPSFVGGSVKVFAAESTGPIKTKLHPRLSTSTKAIWLVFLLITLACGGSLYAAGMDVFNAVNFAMATAATGGFSPLADTTHFAPRVEYIITGFTFLAGINFTLLYATVTRRRLGMLFRSSEFRFYFFAVVVCAAFVAIELIWREGFSVAHAVRSALMHTVSFITTTGFICDDVASWPHATWAVLALLMFVGACSGSTSGGLKCIRGVMLLKVVKNQFRQILHPNAVLPLRVDGVNVSEGKRVTLLAFLTIYLLLCLVCSFAMAATGIDPIHAVTITLSCLSNAGPALALDSGDTMSWAVLPDAAKWLCTALMLIGRLEIFSVLVIFTPAFWEEN